MLGPCPIAATSPVSPAAAQYFFWKEIGKLLGEDRVPTAEEEKQLVTNLSGALISARVTHFPFDKVDGVVKKDGVLLDVMASVTERANGLLAEYLEKMAAAYFKETQTAPSEVELVQQVKGMEIVFYFRRRVEEGEENADVQE